jgi:hypothetical protein
MLLKQPHPLRTRLSKPMVQQALFSRPGLCLLLLLLLLPLPLVVVVLHMNVHAHLLLYMLQWLL